MSSISTNVFPPKKNVAIKSLHHRRRWWSSRYRGHDRSCSLVYALQCCCWYPLSQLHMMLVSQNSKHFCCLSSTGSSSQASRGVAACLQQGKEVLLQIESASMPLDVHKNCLRICIVRFIEHQQQAR